MSFNDDEIVCVTANDYRIYFLYVTKDEDINFLRNDGLTVKSGILLSIKTYYHIKDG